MGSVDKLNDLHDTKDLVQHKDVTTIIQAVSQGHSYLEIKKLLKSLKQRTKSSVFQNVLCALVYTMVKLNRIDLIDWILDKYLLKVKNHLSELLVFACICQYYKITTALLKAGANPHQRVLKTTMFRSAPHEDIVRTMEAFKSIFSQNSSDDFSAWEIALSKDEVVLFQQMYKCSPNTDLEEQDVSFLNRYKKKRLNLVYKINPLLDVHQFGAHSILKYCQANHLYHLSSKNLANLKKELRKLFKRSSQQLDTLRTLFQHGFLKGNQECLFPITLLEEEFLPANQLHHVVSLGNCAYLDEYYMPFGYDYTDCFKPQVPDIVAFLLQQGVQADGLVESTVPIVYEHPYIRPVTLVASHATLWFLGKCDDVCPVDVYIARIHQILNLLPFHPHNMKPFEICPVFFTLMQTLAMAFALQTSDIWYNKYDQERLAVRSKQALMITEDLCLYFLKEGFKMRPENNTIFYLMSACLTHLEYCFRSFDRMGDGADFFIPVLDEFGSFFVRILKVFCAYHDSVHTYLDRYRLHCCGRLHHFDDWLSILKILLFSSSDKQYHQMLELFTEFARVHKQGTSSDLLEFCENRLANPRTLKEMCRAIIFQAVKAPVFKHAEELSLPKTLVMYIVELS